MGGIATVCPELTIEHLVYSLMESLDENFAPDCALLIPGSDTEKVFNSRSIAYSALAYYRTDLVSKVHKPFPLDKDSLFGCTIEFGKAFMVKSVPADAQSTFAEWLKNGLVCTNIEWHYVFMRCQYLITALATYIDEIRRVIKDESVVRTKMLAPVFNETDESGALVCLNCKRLPESGKSLLTCARWYIINMIFSFFDT
jgi:hypothetical protein